ncbi:esterase/lipase family protein [Micromonospora echinospora]|uniref:esterase/lipase family protein n=1 Tax=Micromonospora echinospora TaxID=1877 RepID=UPI00366A9816
MLSRWRLLVLLGVAAAVPLAESLVLVSIGFRQAEGLIGQSSAVWPYDSYHDMRWLLVYHQSWWAFGLGLVGAIVVRGALSAALVGLAWPPGRPRPSRRSLLLRNLGVAALTAAIVTPFAALAVAASVVSLSWVLFASLIPMVILAPFLQRMAVGAGWWRGLPTAELAGWSLLNFVVITVAGGLVWSADEAWTPAVAVAVGVINGLLWNRTVRAAVLPSHVRLRRVPVVPIVVVLTLAIPLVAQALTQRDGATSTFSPPIFTRPLPQRVPYAVILLAGHNSAYDGRPSADPNVERFSYNGLDSGDRPLPYRANATHQSLESSAQKLAAQVEAVHRRTGRPVALIGESEGAMVARTYLRSPKSPVTALLMLSPLVRTGRAYYPPPTADSGYGVATGWLLRAMYALANLGSATDDQPDEPFVRSLLEDAPFYRFQTMCPIPGVRVVAFLPTVTAVESTPGPFTQIPVVEVPSLHVELLDQRMVHDKVIDFLAGADLKHVSSEYGLIQRLGAAWQAPLLTVNVNPVWRSEAPPGPAFSAARICRTVR